MQFLYLIPIRPSLRLPLFEANFLFWFFKPSSSTRTLFLSFRSFILLFFSLLSFSIFFFFLSFFSKCFHHSPIFFFLIFLSAILLTFLFSIHVSYICLSIYFINFTSSHFSLLSKFLFSYLPISLWCGVFRFFEFLYPFQQFIAYCKDGRIILDFSLWMLFSSPRFFVFLEFHKWEKKEREKDRKGKSEGRKKIKTVTEDKEW